ncbi:MAG: hypothetical protein K6G28_04290 [Acholeplasmatales bacterium]|nr:hypothetical protein [Acholeplasmatales bacterium]
MKPIEVIVIIAAALFVLIIFGNRIYRIIKHKPIDTCAECHNNMKMAVKRMRKQALKNKKRALKQQARQNKKINSLEN